MVGCFATGARWSEAERLPIQRIRNGLIEFSGTKSGRVRNVPINDGLEAGLRRHHVPAETGPQVFDYACSAFRDAVDRIRLTLPEGQLTHVLRHTFASYFMINGGNILTLQKILGHANLTMTMLYAHLAPEYLQEARTLNPLTALTLG
jgi:site-specific recombinase XerD